MSYGYSQSLARANRQASSKSLGVVLGRVCIEKDISVIAVADAFKVSRMTVYNWFKGVSAPHPSLHLPIERYIRTHSKK
jgi:hypothetical protein